MSIVKPLYIVDIFADIVSRVENVVLSTIQANETAALGSTKIQGINYQKGHKIELIQTLSQMEANASTQQQKYPMVYLVQDFTERRGRSIKQYAEVNLQIFIAHYTEATRKVDDRMTKVFKPVLYPIYYELMNQISLEPLIIQADEQDIRHDKTDRLYWGTQSFGGNKEHSLNDYLDAIEVNNLTLNFNFKTC